MWSMVEWSILYQHLVFLSAPVLHGRASHALDEVCCEDAVATRDREAPKGGPQTCQQVHGMRAPYLIPNR